MKIIIAGDGKVGSTLTRQLTAEGYDLTIIDSNQKVLERSLEQYDVMAIQGNCASMDILLQAGIQEADLLIAVTNADEINLLCCLTAHGLNPDVHTIARIRNPEYINQTYRMRNLFELSLVINPERDAALEIERLLRFPGFLKRDSFVKGRAEIVELRVDANSKLCNIPLNRMDSIVKCKVLVCTVQRDGVAIAPDGDFMLQEGDHIFVTAPAHDLTTLLRNLGIITRKVSSVILCGGGTLSIYLAQLLLKCNISVQIIEQDQNRCMNLAKLLPDADIIQGDATNRSLLESCGLSSCDALVTMTGLDELNIVISLYGSSRNVPQIVTKLGRMDTADILDDLPVGSIICPKELCSNNIVRYVRAMKNQAGAAVAIHSIADGQVEAIEFLVDKETMHCGEPLKSLKLRKGVLLACISHGAKMEIPSGESSFNVGDTVVVISSGDEIIYQLNDIFSSWRI